MGAKSDLSDIEKTAIVRFLGEGYTPLTISKQLKRDHRTVKKFIKNSQNIRCRKDKGKFRSIKQKEMLKLKLSVCRNQNSSSKKIFIDAIEKLPCRQTRCNILNKISKCVSSDKRPHLTKNTIKQRMDWGRKYMKIKPCNIIWTDECRATLDGPDGFQRGWNRSGWKPPTCKRRQQGGGSVMFWVGIYKSEVIGPFKIDGNLNSEKYIQLIKNNVLPFFEKFSPSKRRELIFMQDNAPSHASNMTKLFLQENGFSGDRLMNWPSNSPDLNPTENCFSKLKSIIYCQGKQYNTQKELWNGIIYATRALQSEYIKTLTNSFDSRLIKLFERKGRYTGY